MISRESKSDENIDLKRKLAEEFKKLPDTLANSRAGELETYRSHLARKQRAMKFERERIRSRDGDDSKRVRKIDQRLAYNREFFAELDVEIHVTELDINVYEYMRDKK
ncbi:MAG: hypothetical protein P8Y16_01035 [Sulfurimonas sp.]